MISNNSNDSNVAFTRQSSKGYLDEVSRTYFPEPNCDNPQWVAVEISAKSSLKKTVKLDDIKSNPILIEIALLKQSRLSVMPITHEEYEEIIRMSEN